MKLPLMPKATAVWLLDNTSLTFTQISEFCELHILEVESMEKVQEAMQDPEIAKARTDAGVNLDTQEIVFLVE